MVCTIILSMEIELAWGLHFLKQADKYSALSAARKKETETLRQVLTACNRYFIPILFAVVGHLFLEKCAGNHQHGHFEHWFDEDPGTNRFEAPHFYAPDLIETILNANVCHEICTHTFSHILADEVDKHVLEWELEKVKELHRNWGIDEPISIVMPQHRSVDHKVLEENGIKVLRVPHPNAPSQTDSFIIKIGRYFNQFLNGLPTHIPKEVNGVIETYGTQLPVPFFAEGQKHPILPFRMIPTSIRRSLCKKRLEKSVKRCISNEEYLHLWMHLWDISNDIQLPVFLNFLKYLSEKANDGDVRIITMRQLFPLKK